MKDHVKLLVIGDDGVGKSSLISSYVSRHFPSEVPAVMTDAILPPQTTSSDVCVTVMDSSTRNFDRDVLKQKILVADSIIALYDVTNLVTLHHLVNIWFPLIKDVCGDLNKPVIISGTKTDLLSDDSDTDQLREILEMFPNVLVCMKCSALQLHDIESIFHYAVDAVIYPLEPIFDIFTHEFTPACRKAFLRIFRALDLDNDNLLSDSEFRDTETKCFNLDISDEELVAMKRQILLGVPDGGLRNDYVTFEGFLGLIKIIIEDSSLRIPWQILRRFDYDDDLEYMIPDEISEVPHHATNQIMELSSDAKDFLLSMARIAQSECIQQQRAAIENDSADESEGGNNILTWDALNSILSVVASDVVHPWCSPPSFLCVWREDSVEQLQANRSLQQSVLLSKLPHIGANITFDAWLTQWHVLAISNPVLTQELLFRIGYIERGDLGIVTTSGSIEQIACYVPQKVSLIGSLFKKKEAAPNARSTVNVCVLGSNCVGKASFVWCLSDLPAPGSLDIEKGFGHEKPQDTVVVGGGHFIRNNAHQSVVTRQFSASSSKTGTTRFRKGTDLQNTFDHLQDTFYISAAAIPHEHVASRQQHMFPSSSKQNRKPEQQQQHTFLDAYDIAVIMFQCGDVNSLQEALLIEQSLPKRLPRLFLASKCDLVQSRSSSSSSGGVSSPYRGTSPSVSLQAAHEYVLEDATKHLQQNDLPDLVLLSTTTGEGVTEALAAVLTVVEEPLRGVPSQWRKKPSEWSRLIPSPLAFLSLSGMSFALYYLWTHKQKEIKEWLRHVSHVSFVRDILQWVGVTTETRH